MNIFDTFSQTDRRVLFEYMDESHDGLIFGQEIKSYFYADLFVEGHIALSYQI